DVFACGLAILLALRMNDIIQLLSMGYSILAAGCLVPFFGGVLWKRGTTAGALASAVVGIAATIGSTLGLIHLPYASITSVALAAVVFVGVSLVCSDPKKE
ncbi:MAG: sodium:solute symporter family protein, partial [Oscillospiraceae bacterium]|nr:sodium:solute symporter family protein [Oscillospiraceae bacterium]